LKARKIMNRLARLLAALVLLGCGLGALPAQAQTVIHIGSGFSSPGGLAVDASGNVFVADVGNNAVKEILAADGYTTVETLGSGFSAPEGVAVDGSGNVFVADTGNNAVKEILAVGGSIPAISPTINTLAAGEVGSPIGLAVDGSGNVFIADGPTGQVLEILAVGGSIPALSPTVISLPERFSSPFSVALDGSDNVFIADGPTGQVLEILAAGGYTTVETLGSEQFQNARGIAIDSNGNVFVAAAPDASTVLELVAAGGYTTVKTLDSGFTFLPSGIAVDANGNVFFADAFNSVVNWIPSVLAVNAVSPTAAPIAGGNTVTIDGTQFVGRDFLVFFGNRTATRVTVDSPLRITATAPPGAGTADHTVDITLSTDLGETAVVAADQYTYIAVPSVSSVSPAVDRSAGGNSVIITGTNFTGTSLVSFGGTAATAYSVESPTQITATAPAAAGGIVDVTVTRPIGGTSPITAADQYHYIAPPSVSSVGPGDGPISGGNSVTITGTNLTGAISVSFGTLAAAGFSVDSATQITAIVPAGSTGSVDVTVAIPIGGTSATGVADGYTYVAAPSVGAIAPSSGPTAGGTVVTITGANLTDTTAVRFGTIAATFLINSATQITATAPPGAAATVDVTVTTPAGASATGTGDHYTYTSAPIVSAVSPASGATAGGNSVTITGGNLTGATSVSFGTIAATSFSVGSAAQITAIAPAGTAGTVDVTVTTPNGTSATSAADAYSYVAAPSVTALAPSSGTTGGGNAVTITGSNLTGATAVKFGTNVATFDVNSATQITATAPSGTAATIDVTVTTAGGTSATGAADRYTYTAAPVVSAVSPSGGPASGGTSVTITGSNFTAASAVSFGAAAATSFTLDSATQIIATAPAGTTGTVDITVTTPNGTSATGATDRYTYTAAPVVGAVSPAGGALAGGNSVTISGSNLTGATAVKFGTVAAASFSVGSASQITATAPGGSAGAVDVTVTTPNGTSAISAADQYTYAAAPSVSAISPSSGSTAGGTSVTITGTSLAGATVVKFGTAAASFSVGSATQITATAPAGTAGTVDVTVTTAGGISAAGAGDRYIYTAAPTVSAVSPASGAASGGNSVIITGSNLNGATGVSFGTVAATSFSVGSATQITATVPAGTAGTVDITVTTPGGTSATSVADGYTYVAAPMVTAISPIGGPASGGNLVTITGTGLAGATAVKFGATTASFTVVSAAEITATAPAGSAGTVDITVTTPDGTSTPGARDRYTYTSAPIVSAVSPANGATSGGTAVTITGVNFTGATAVKFGTAGASFTLASATQITATSPAGSAGVVDITVTIPTGTSAASAADRFTYTTGTSGQVYAYQSTLGVPGVAKADNAHFSGPAAGAVDAGNSHLFIADTGNHRVQVLDAGSLAVVATLGTAGAAGSDNAHLDAPQGVGFDPATGHVLVADSGNDRIQVFDAKSFGYVATLGVAGTAGTDNGHFNLPSTVHLNPASRELYIADTGNDRIQVFDADTLGYIATIGTSGVSGTDSAHFNQPKDAEFNPSANQIMVADGGNGRLQLFDAGSLAYAATIGGLGLGTADNDYLGSPGTAAFDPANNLVLVADSGADARVQVFDAMTYTYVLTLGTTGAGGAGNSQFAGPSGIASDPAHARIFIGDRLNDRIQVYAIGPAVNFASVLPGSRSVELGTPATIFASMINAGTTALGGCQVALPVTAPDGLTLSYQTTNPATNALTGTPNTPATIAPNDGVQSFLVSLQGTSAFVAAAMPLDFDCSGVAPAAVTTGVDTLDLTLSATPIADIIALAATPSENGIVEIPSGGAAAFAVASSNVGAASLILASVDTGSATLPLTAVLCQSNPATGQCLATPAGSVPLSFAAGATPTFSVFLQVSGAIPLDPAKARVFVRFKDADGALHGSTSVAVATE
jgi:large repetitive protein